MATTTTTTNKPLNPRAQDLSPKGYNRAALYSGKALDFDGVNDYVDLWHVRYNGLHGYFNIHKFKVSEHYRCFAFCFFATFGYR
jgi:hypothetical protein